jgi:hypothetical protein
MVENSDRDTKRTPTRRSSTFDNVRQLPSGRWRASYWHEGTRHVAFQTFPAKADADAWLANTRTDISQERWIDPVASQITVETLSKLWLKSNTRKRASSVARDNSILNTHVIPALGPRAIVTSRGTTYRRSSTNGRTN